MERQRFSRRGRRRKRWGEKIKDFLRNFIAFMFSNVGIIGLVVGYTILGAFIFQKIEGQASRSRMEDVYRERNMTADRLWNITCCGINTFEEQAWRNEVSVLVLEYQRTLVAAMKTSGFDGAKSIDNWSFSGAFLYSLTVITTIGYGNVTPHTEWGKMVTVLYAIIGMPLFLLYLSNIGDILAKSFKWTYAKLWLCKGCPGARRRPVLKRSVSGGASSNEGSIELGRTPDYGDEHSWTPGARPAPGRRIFPADVDWSDVPQVNASDVGFDRSKRSQSRMQYDQDGQVFHIHSVSDAPRRPRNRYAHEEEADTDGEPNDWNNKRSERSSRGDQQPHISKARSPAFMRSEEIEDEVLCDPKLGVSAKDPRTFHGHRSRLPVPYGPDFDDEDRDDDDDDSSEDSDDDDDDDDETLSSTEDLDNAFEHHDEQETECSESSSYDPQTVTVPLTLCLAIMVGYVCGGAVLFSEWEDWNMLDGSYFCFISLSTIGFGDIVPGGTVYSHNIELSFIFCSMYLMLGMALIAMCFNLMQEEVIHKMRSCIRTVRYMTRCTRRRNTPRKEDAGWSLRRANSV